jgi:hypothetical protein
MSGIKISNLPASTTPLSGSEIIPLVQSGVTKRATVAQIGTVTATGSTTSRTLPDRFADVVSVEDFGAIGDGITDDSAAFTAAFAAANVVYGTHDKIYSIKNVNIDGRTFDGRGCGLRDHAGASYAVNLSGYRPALKDVFFQDQGNYPSITTTSASAILGATSINVTSAAGFAANKVIILKLSGVETRFFTVITNVVGTTVSLRDAVPGAVNAGAEVISTYGLINVTDAQNWLIEDVQVINSRAALLVKPSSPVNFSNKGTIKTFNVEGSRYFAYAKVENAAGIKAYDMKLWCGWSETINYIGNGSATAYNLNSPAFLKRDVTITVNGIAQVIGVNWTFSDADTITFSSPPANGAAIVISHFRDGYFGFVEDQRNTSIISGGSGYIHLEVLDAIDGMYLYETDLTDFDEIIVDTISDTAIRLVSTTSTCIFGKVFLGFTNSCIKAYSAIGTSFGQMYSDLVPTVDTVTGTVGNNILADNSALLIDAGGWVGPNYGFTPSSGGYISLRGGNILNTSTSSTIPAATSAYMNDYGGTLIIAPQDMTLFGFYAACDTAPGAGRTFTYNVYVNATLAGTGVISGAGAFSTGKIWCNQFAAPGDSILVQVVTSASASAARHRCGIIAI